MKRQKITTALWNILVILLLSFNGYTQKIVQHYNVTNTAGPGLKDFVVNDLLEDNDGNLWVATEYGGLNKWDGEKWSNYAWNTGLPSSTVHSLAMTSDGCLWVGTKKGLTILNNGSCNDRTINNNGLGPVEILDVLVDHQDSIWVLTYGNISKYSNHTWEVVGSVDYATTLYEDQSGQIWTNPYLKGALVYNQSQWDTINTDNGLLHNRINSFIEDKESNLWIGTFGGICKYKAGNWEYEFENQRIDALHRNDDVIWMGIDNYTIQKFENNMWTTVISEFRYARNIFHSSSGELYVGNDFQFAVWNGVELVSIDTDPGLGSNDINDIKQDHSGNWWIASDRDYSIFDGTSWMNPGLSGIDPLEVNDIETGVDGRIWLATRFGVYVLSAPYDGTNWIRYRTDDGLAGDRVFNLKFSDKGGIWMLTDHGASYFHNGVFTNYTVDNGLINRYVYDVFEDPSGDIWFATFGGISRKSGDNWLSYTTDDGLKNDQVYQFTSTSSGNLFAHHKWGLDSLDQNVWKPFTHRFASSLVEDTKGNYWITTRSGLYKYDIGTKEFTNLSEDDGLPFNVLSCMFYDQDNEQLWIGSSGEGVVIVDISASVPTLELGLHKKLELYPNPASTIIYINNPLFGDKQLPVTLFSLDGKIVKNSSVSFNHGKGMLLTDELPVGTYIIHLNYSNNLLVQRLQVLR